MGFVLVTRFIDHSQIVTTSNYNSFANSYTLQFTTTRPMCLHQSLPANGFNGGRSPCSGFQIYPRPQLPAPHSNSSQRLNCTSPLTHSLHSTVLNCTALTNWTGQVRSGYNWRSVSRSVLVSSPIWGSWPDINYVLKVTVLSIGGAFSDERSLLLFVLVSH
jgi:hypothetical protein